MNWVNSSEVNCVPLSETSCSGNPYQEKREHIISMVLCEVVLDMVITSGHFECASTMMRKVLPRKGPAKSTWRRFHGASGQTHGCSGVTAGEDFTA